MCQIRSTRFLFTSHPAPRSSAVIRRAAAILPDQGDDILGQCRLVIRRHRLLALRGPRLPQNPASKPFRHAEFGRRVLHTIPAARRAQKFPEAASFRNMVKALPDLAAQVAASCRNDGLKHEIFDTLINRISTRCKKVTSDFLALEKSKAGSSPIYSA